jgi:hypothetical protein
MTDSISLGLDGLTIPAGTHICAFFRGIPERDQIMVPFLREGLRAGNKCMCIIDDEVEGVRTALGADGGFAADAKGIGSTFAPQQRPTSGEARSRPKRCSTSGTIRWAPR